MKNRGQNEKRENEEKEERTKEIILDLFYIVKEGERASKREIDNERETDRQKETKRESTSGERVRDICMV